MTAVTRRALIISNPGEEGAKNYCKGVFVDVENYLKYLQTPQGGWWSRNKIDLLHRPTRTRLRDAVSQLESFDYSYVAFSGHGWHSSVENATVLTLRSGEEVAYHELLKGASKRTLVLDCCREKYHEPITEGRRDQHTLASLMQRRVPDPGRCREEFLNQINKALRGVVVINSCAIDETAGDSDMLGGRYTAGLFTTALQWAEAQSRATFQTEPDVLSIVECHEGAAEYTRIRSGRTQNPTIEKSRSGPYFPLAVFA